MARNPKWERDELILALDLYFAAGQLGIHDSRVLALSDILNRLSVHKIRPDRDRFRNANSVVLKLSNFRACDPNDPVKGLEGGGRGTSLLWDEFTDNRGALHELAESIRRAVSGPDTLTIPEPDEVEVAATEGTLLYRLHRVRERDRGLVRRKKQRARERLGKLCCEVCDFDFHQRYGAHGDGYIECHHKAPLAQTGVRKTRLDDLALVCANCHRMLHRGKPWLTPDELKAILSSTQ